MVRKVSVWFGMGHYAMQYISTLVLLRSLLCLWLNTERHEKKFYCCIDGRLPGAGISCDMMKVDFVNFIARPRNRGEMALY